MAKVAVAKVKTIHKFPFPIKDVVTLQLPVGAIMQCVNVQQRRPCLWAVVDSEMPLTERVLEIYATGQLMSESPKVYVGTIMVDDGLFVFHVYERTGV